MKTRPKNSAVIIGGGPNTNPGNYNLHYDCEQDVMLLECNLSCIILCPSTIQDWGDSKSNLGRLGQKGIRETGQKKWIGSLVPSRPNQSVTKTLPLILDRLRITSELEVIGKGGLLTKSTRLP